MPRSDSIIACSNCFNNEGLRLDAERLGESNSSVCPRCTTTDGRKLNTDQLMTLVQHFFVWGSLRKFEYGAAPAVQFNDRRETDISMPQSLIADASLLEATLGIGFFSYGPRFWMFGEIEPLKSLQQEESRAEVIHRILREYDSTTLSTNEKIYRIRKDPIRPSHDNEYDSPPADLSKGRLDTAKLPVLYGSPDLQTCLHECRVTAEDDLFVATLRPTRDLKLLNLTSLLDEPPEVSEFESLDLAVNMLFLAGEHSYPITRALSRSARSVGFDGIMYPSYFSMLRNGVKPFETTYGISHRKIPQYKKFEQSKIATNIALFGRPIEEALLEVSSINRVILSTVIYSVHFGPVMDTT